ncbi:hypothetical protein BJ170DRAFT_684872 [Xylariales sp. AK1849]|nr:hypothetical protein BJ170DRAFT_684872 [Xylariales sp. AK1849]
MKTSPFILATLAGIPVSFAQSSTSTSESTGTSTSSAQTHTVSVGVNHKFVPDSITANKGDIIEFQFFPTNHSVAKAEYKNPCVPYEYINPGGETFFSGPEESEERDLNLKYQLLINDTSPVFFYCTAPGSCIDYGMVGVINPNDNFTLAVQKAYQQNVTFQLSPGEPWPNEAPAPTTSGSSGAAPTTTASSASSGGSRLGAGAIAGIAVGAAAVLVMAIALVWFCGRKGGIEKGYRRSTVVNPSAPMIEANYPNNPKSPPPPSTLSNSPFGMPQAEAFRSSSPAQWSHTGSPPNSYMGHPSPGFQSPYSDAYQQPGAYYDQPKPEPIAPAELPASPHHPGSPPPHNEMRHEFPG